MRLTDLVELADFLVEEPPLDEESEEHELSTEKLLRTTGSGISGTGFLGRCGFFILFLDFRFDSSETLTLFPAGPRMARVSETGLVATDIDLENRNCKTLSKCQLFWVWSLIYKLKKKMTMVKQLS